MTSATYSFKRADGRTGFLRTNTANTDARNALYEWIEKNGSRSYDLVNDDDDELVACLTFDEGDGDAGPDLERECDKVGIERNTVVSG